MKKLMIVFATLALALSVQAASISWRTGTTVKAPTSADNGAFGTTAAAGTLSMYVWLVSADVYNSTSVDSIYGTYGSKLDTATASTTGGKGSTGVAVETVDLNWNPTSDTPYYAIVLTMYDNGDGITGYIANMAKGNVNTGGTGTGPTNLAKNLGGTGGTVINGWTMTSGGGTIPEPTSGLLLALGGAILALRRKQK